ncbi:hypothetical protein B566_EDAN013954, partial [Ephemera danica]
VLVRQSSSSSRLFLSPLSHVGLANSKICSFSTAFLELKSALPFTFRTTHLNATFIQCHRIMLVRSARGLLRRTLQCGNGAVQAPLPASVPKRHLLLPPGATSGLSRTARAICQDSRGQDEEPPRILIT